MNSVDFTHLSYQINKIKELLKPQALYFIFFLLAFPNFKVSSGEYIDLNILSFFFFPVIVFPKSETDATYKNNLRDVTRMLRTKHGSNYMVSRSFGCLVSQTVC